MTDDRRPNPEELLQLAQAEEARHQRGRLKVFFGANAGVGKTFAMLEAALAQKSKNVDVLAGVVETHGRKETAALTDGIEKLPLKTVEYKGATLKEFDLDGALARRPSILLIDELAHTNAPGCKNAKRWQDVQELLDAGINVYTTVNVQHLESLNDIVAQITGIPVRETVPDSIVENADEIELIDIAPDDLLQRLKEGKVYIPDQAARAAQSFFRKGNLIALRELALRRTAERVNQQVQSYRQEQAISGSWPTAERLLVCVGPSPFSSRLVRATRRMAAAMHAEWIAVHVETPATANLPEQDLIQIKQNLRLAQQLGAEIVTLNGRSVVEEIVALGRKRNITKIIAGKPMRPRWRDRLFGSLVDELIRESGDIDVFVIKGEQDDAKPSSFIPREAALDKPRYALAAGIIALCTALAWLMFPLFEHANLIMLYLVGVMIAAVRLGRGPAILASILSVAAFDFFFVPPYLTFAVTDSQYVFTFGVMLAVALVISSMAASMQRHAELTELRERKTASLYAMSRQLSSTRGVDELFRIAVRHISEIFDSDVIALMPDAEGRLAVRAGNESNFPWSARERGVAQWVLELGQAAGQGTDTLPKAEASYFPLKATRSTVGVIGLRTRSGSPLTADQMTMLEAVISQAALAIEIDRMADEARKAQIETEAEKSRSALLSSVSHDLRTPLASICGASSTLLSQQSNLPVQAQQELLETINEEGNRLTRLINNILEMTKLESGAKVKKEWCHLEDVVGSALLRLENVLDHRRVQTHIPESFPEVPIDITLIEEVLINLLENAAKYTPPGTPIEVSACMTEKGVQLSIADRGPGISTADMSKVFEKFYRGADSERKPGTGLGLAICKAIVEAHGGRIWAENRTGGGAVFHFTLPLEGAPASAVQLSPADKESAS